MGGQDLLVAIGFRVQVHEFEECWVYTPSDEARQVLGEARECMSSYWQLVTTRQQEAAKLRVARLAGEDADRKMTMSHIAGDKEDRRDKVWVKQQQQQPLLQTPVAATDGEKEGDQPQLMTPPPS